MAKPGPKPRGKVKLEWSHDFSYAVGLLVTDGNLSPDRRHICFTSKDLELAQLFQKSLGIKGHIGRKAGGANKEKKYFVVQFSDVLFYEFLVAIGLMPNKSKIVAEIKIPPQYFFDYLRGAFDGDGCTYSYFDPRWKSSFMFYTCFVSASLLHIEWMQEEIYKRLGIQGHITHGGKNILHQLKYAKSDSLKLLRKMYKNKSAPSLTRKRLKIEEALSIVGERL